MCKENDKNPKPDSNKGKENAKSHIGENLSAQEELRKAYELRPKIKVDPKKKK
jgi:hypothetical protein